MIRDRPAHFFRRYFKIYGVISMAVFAQHSGVRNVAIKHKSQLGELVTPAQKLMLYMFMVLYVYILQLEPGS